MTLYVMTFTFMKSSLDVFQIDTYILMYSLNSKI